MTQRATDWKVLYGELRQFCAYFDDRGKAERFARDHHSDTIIPLAPVDPAKAPLDRPEPA
jgi:hypothetical protein